jgi:hypothetical protein
MAGSFLFLDFLDINGLGANLKQPRNIGVTLKIWANSWVAKRDFVVLIFRKSKS